MRRAILVDIIEPQTTPEESLARLNELERLTTTYGGFVIVRRIQKRQQPDYQTYIGKGKLEQIISEATEKAVDVIIVNNRLKPRQIYNIEKLVEQKGIEVWDKIGLILKIFDRHAVTREAKLQIELAGIRHLGPRIFKMGLELMRQGGGIGTRGKGETNIEIMKRHMARREKTLKETLEKIETSHSGQRRRRRHDGFKTVALVGYTNAGKSSLMVALTKKNVKVQDELFATLDTRLGKVFVPEANACFLLSDTIGFIRDLPPELIDAFHSTLAETVDADMLLHVIDADDLELEWKIQVVEGVLQKLGCHQKPLLHVFNKIDAISEYRLKEIQQKHRGLKPLFVSAVEKTNLHALKNAIAKTVLQ